MDLPIDSSVCKISIIDFHNNTAQYYSTEDNYGLSISNNSNPAFTCDTNSFDENIKISSNFPSNFSEKQKNMTISLANIINEVKKEQGYTNKEISKILSMSNIQGVKFTYHDSFQDGHLRITSNGYGIDTISQPPSWKNDKSEFHYLVVFSTNRSTKTKVIATTEVKDLDTLKFLISKDNASFIYDTEKMKIKTVIQ